jgi:L-malate glycosyltransferase
VDALICPASSNAKRVTDLPWNPRLKVFTIPHGYSAPVLPSRSKSKKDFTLGLIARGVPEKGWNEALAAARIARQTASKSLRLIFVGSGPCLDSIRRSLDAEDLSWVLLTGQQDKPEHWIAECDACLLPSYLPGESLPLSIIEYLACGKPVLATPIGGIPEMLQTSDGLAGVLLPQQPDGRADVPALAEAISQLMKDAALLRTLALRTEAAFARFSMETCVRSYEAAFAELLAA